jgi:hypothetical protein
MSQAILSETAGKSLKRKNTTFTTRKKFEIKKQIILFAFHFPSSATVTSVYDGTSILV